MSAYILPVIGVLIVLIAVAVGFRDLVRFRPRRVGAIAGVCFSESVRRRILWITPLAIIGVVAVSQLTRPADEQDAIRQTIKYSLFASGLIVIVAAVILAATNLPREIDNRVIYTIVTKPTTRLEIVSGKVLGFAYVSAMILLIMGVFTWGYARLRAANMERRIGASLKAGTADPNTVQSLGHYVSAGLLETKSLAWPVDLQIYSRLPDPQGGVRWMEGGRNQFFIQTFTLTDADRNELVSLLGAASPGASGGVPGGPPALGPRSVFLMNTLQVRQRTPTPEEELDLRGAKLPTEEEFGQLVAGPQSPSTAPSTAPSFRAPLPQIAVAAYDPGTKYSPLAQADIDPARNIAAPTVPIGAPPEWRSFPIELTGEGLQKLLEGRPPAQTSSLIPSALGSDAQQGQMEVAPEAKDASVFSIEVSAVTPTVEYGADEHSAYLAVYEAPPPLARGRNDRLAAQPLTVPPAGAGEFVLYDKADNRIRLGPVQLKAGDPIGFVAAAEPTRLIAVAGDQRVPMNIGAYQWLRAVKKFYGSRPGRPGTPSAPRFLSRFGRTGMQIRGVDPTEGNPSVAVYRFRNADVGGRSDGNVALQLRVTVERGGDLDAERNTTSRVEVLVRNRQTGKSSPWIQYLPETSRFSYVDVPAEYFQGGDFDVALRGLTPGQWLGVQGPAATNPSAAVVTSLGFFEVNLFKSLFILWLLSILVVVIAVFCSTFLSWPIAVVLTMIVLLGRWGVNELGDALDPGAQRGLASDIFRVRDASVNTAVTNSMEALSSMLRTVSTVLPDVGKFPVIEDIDRGVSIPAAKLGRAGRELVFYGLPLLMLTYLVLRNKEVAP